MADAIRRVTVGRGYDPRDFTLLACGGAGPLHAADYARELDIQRVLVPLADVSSVWSAYGIALADAAIVSERALYHLEPFDVSILQAAGRDLAEESLSRLGLERQEEATMELSLRIKYKLQAHVLDVPVQLSEFDDIESIVTRFEAMYRRLYGAHSGFRGAGLEITGLKCRAARRRHERSRSPRPRSARRGGMVVEDVRAAYWAGEGRLPTRVLREEGLKPRGELKGPAIIELAGTTVAVPPSWTVAGDSRGNLVLLAHD